MIASPKRPSNLGTFGVPLPKTVRATWIGGAALRLGGFAEAPRPNRQPGVSSRAVKPRGLFLSRFTGMSKAMVLTLQILDLMRSKNIAPMRFLISDEAKFRSMRNTQRIGGASDACGG